MHIESKTQNTTQQEAHKKPNHQLILAIFFFPALLLIGTIVQYIFPNYTFSYQNVVVMEKKQNAQSQQVIVIHKVEANATPVIEKPNMDEILAKVYRLESSSGKNDGCRRTGKFNGYGFAQNKNTWQCYDSKTKVTELVATWFADHLKEMDLPTALCYYNTGYKVNNCQYYQNYLTLK